MVACTEQRNLDMQNAEIRVYGQPEQSGYNER